LSESTRPEGTSTPLPPKYQALVADPKAGYGIQEAGMAQLDDIVGNFMTKVEDKTWAPPTTPSMETSVRRIWRRDTRETPQ
jgi:hypothetical protein